MPKIQKEKRNKTKQKTKQQQDTCTHIVTPKYRTPE